MSLEGMPGFCIDINPFVPHLVQLPLEKIPFEQPIYVIL